MGVNKQNKAHIRVRPALWFGLYGVAKMTVLLTKNRIAKVYMLFIWLLTRSINGPFLSRHIKEFWMRPAVRRWLHGSSSARLAAGLIDE
jgi:hypothetical protein